MIEATKKGTEERARLEKIYTKLTEDENKKRLEKSLETSELILDQVKQFSDTAFGIFSVASENRITAIDDEMARLEASTETRLQELETMGLAEAEFNKKKEEIVKQAEAQRLQLEKRKKAEQKKQARAEKAQAIVSATINTALAVVSAIATAKTNVGRAVWAAIVGAMGAAQIATIAAQKIPEFTTGGIVNNPAPSTLTREDGIIGINRGESVLNQQATAVLGEDAINALNRGDNISPMVTINVNGGDTNEVVDTLNDYFRQFGTSAQGVAI